MKSGGGERAVTGARRKKRSQTETRLRPRV